MAPPDDRNADRASRLTASLIYAAWVLSALAVLFMLGGVAMAFLDPGLVYALSLGF